MSDRSGLSRRKVLAAVSGVGLASLSTGFGTGATFADREQFGGTLEAGIVAVDVDCDSCTTAGDTVAFDIGGIEPGSGRVEESFRVSIPRGTNPARVWGRTACPKAVKPLAAALEVRLSIGDCPDGDDRQLSPSPGSGKRWHSLDALRRELASGFRLNDPAEPCLGPGESRCLTLEYRLPESASWAVAAEASLEFEFYAEQCRHVDEDSVGRGPFPAVRCPEFDCPDCIELGKVDVVGNRLVAGERYGLDGSSGFTGDGEYELQVLSVTNKRDGDGSEETVCAGFRLLRDGAEAVETPLCKVTVGGGRPRTPPGDPDSRVAVYDIEPPLSRDPSLSRDPPLSRTRAEVCAAHGDDKLDPESVPDGERPAISNITVFVCAEGRTDETPDPECVPCRDDSGSRIAEATFEYEGPDDSVSITIDQRSSGNSPQEAVTEPGVDAGDRFTVPLNGSGSPDFDATVDAGEAHPIGSFHTSCSRPFGPGTVVSDGTYSLTVVDAVDKNGDAVCEVTK